MSTVQAHSPVVTPLVQVVEEILKRVTGKEDASLHKFQKEAVALIDAGRNVIVVAPTGSGKTVVGLAAVAKYGKAIWISPSRALMGETADTIEKVLPDKYVVVSNKDYAVPFRRIVSADVVVTSPFKGLPYITSIDPRSFPVIVVDEIHGVSGNPTFEALLTIAKMRGFRVVGLSATISDEDARVLATFLNATLVNSATKRPIPLRYEVLEAEVTPDGYIVKDKRFSGIYARADDLVVDAVIEILRESEKNAVLVWTPWRRHADDLAATIADRVKELGLLPARPELASGVAVGNRHDHLLKSIIPFGVGIHHGGVSSANRHYVEELLRNKDLRVVVTCYTLSQGVNFPVSHVVLSSIYAYSREPLDPSTFHQIAGRAGRPGYDIEGTVVIPAFGPVEVEIARALVATPAAPIQPSLVDRYVLTKVAAYILLTGIPPDVFVSSSLTAAMSPERKQYMISILDSVTEEVVKTYFERTPSGYVPKGKKEKIAAQMMMHPLEFRLAEAMASMADYNDVLEQAISVAKSAGVTVSFQARENLHEMGFLAYYSGDWVTRNLADAVMTLLGTAQVYINRAYGFRSPEAEHGREIISRYLVGSNPFFMELMKVMREDEIKRVIRSGYVPEEFIDPNYVEEAVLGFFRVIFWRYRVVNLERAKKILDVIRKYATDVSDKRWGEIAEKVRSLLYGIAKKNRGKLVGRW